MIHTFLGGFFLPVNPFNEITFSVSTISTSYNIAEFGEISELGNSKQKTFSIKSLITENNYSFSTGGKIGIDDILDMIEAKQPVRFIITGDGIDINMLVSIDSFKYTVNYGEIKEYYYTLSLKEYREHLIKKVVAKNGVLTIPIRTEDHSMDHLTVPSGNNLTDSEDFKKTFSNLAGSTTFSSSAGGIHGGSSGGF